MKEEELYQLIKTWFFNGSPVSHLEDVSHSQDGDLTVEVCTEDGQYIKLNIPVNTFLTDKNVAPFPFQYVHEPGSNEEAIARWEDILLAIQSDFGGDFQTLRIQLEDIDIRSIRAWFARWHLVSALKWDKTNVTSYMADEEDSPWMVRWRLR